MDEEYKDLLSAIVDVINKQGLTATTYFAHDRIFELNEKDNAAVQHRRMHITDKEYVDNIALFKETGMYGQLGLDVDERLALFLVSFDIKRFVEIGEIKRSCLPLNQDSPIIKRDKTLRLGYDGELLSAEGASLDSSGQLLVFPSSICRTVAILNSHFELYKTLFDIADAANIYIRVDGSDVSQSKEFTILEEVIRPIDPKFIQTLDLRRDRKKYGIYELQKPVDVKDPRWWDYSHGYGRLEVVFKRNRDSLSCMIEEIPREMSGRVLRGLCLHATCPDEVGTKFDDATAEHIDGAVNYYFDSDATTRINGSIQYSECDASCRTHLFRINKVKLRELINISHLFFGATTLVSDWLGDQFGQSPPA